jgi:hypothetical protein
MAITTKPNYITAGGWRAENHLIRRLKKSLSYMKRKGIADMRQAARIDANQNEIVQALRDVGASVAITSMVGAGFPDIVVGYRGQNYMIEIKDGSKSPSRRKLTPDEKEFHDLWRGTVIVVNNINEVLEAVGAI